MLIRAVKSADLWVGMVLVALGAVCVWGAASMFVPRVMSDVVGPRVFPMMLGVLLVIEAAVIWARAVLRGSDKVEIGRLGMLGAVIGSSILYLFLIGYLGYVASSALFLVFLFYFLGERRHWLTVAVALAIVLAFYVGFGNFLGVSLPKGPLGF